MCSVGSAVSWAGIASVACALGGGQGIFPVFSSLWAGSTASVVPSASAL